MLIPTPGTFARSALAVAFTLGAAFANAYVAPPLLTRSDAAAGMLDARVNLKSSYQHASAARPGAAAAGLNATKNVVASGAVALHSLSRSKPALAVKFSGLTGAPTSLRDTSGWLTPAAVGRSSEAIVRDYLGANSALFGLSSTDLNDLVALGDSPGGDSGLRMLRLEQQIDGRPVFQSESRFLLDGSGRLAKYVGQLVPHARATTPTFDPATLLSPNQAVVKLLAFEGRTADPAAFAVTSENNGRLLLSENDDYVAGDITARQVLFPLSPGLLVPAWSLVVFTSGSADWYAVIDAQTGDVLWRKNIRDYASAHDARFRVYVQADGVTPADSPAPQSPNTATPGAGTQYASIAPTIVSMHTAYDPVASPNGWIDDCPAGGCTANETQTLGNNVLACIDQVQTGGNANVCDTAAATVLDGNGRPTGNPDANGRNRDFLGTTPRDFQTNFLPPPQAGNPEAGQTSTGNGTSGTAPIDQFRRGVTTHIFYATNWYHDKLFRLGFDEASGNFQQTNFSGMGLGADRVNVDVDDGSGTNNANFATPPDGTSGRMQMYRFDGPTIDRDGALDAEVFLHEATHGVSNRLVGNGAGLNWDPARGLGEGWSDFVALSLLNNTNADDPNGRYASGAYATYKLQGLPYLDNYVYGIRRFPYSTDNSVNPLTWADVDDVTNDLSGGIAPSTVGFNNNGGMEVHNVGEIWALTLWEVRSRVIADTNGANGDVPTGNHTMLQLVIDGLKMTPINTTFTEARDAILDADCATNACANEASIWGGFADRGLGYGAQTPYSVMGRYVSSHQAIHESFGSPVLDVLAPATDVTIDDSASNNNGVIDPGEAIKLTVKLSNPWRAAGKAVTSATATLSTSTFGVTIYDATATYGAIAPQGSATGDSFLLTVDPSVTCGTAIDFTLTTVSNLGTTSTTFRLRVGGANGTDPVVTYTGALSGGGLTITSNAPRGVFNQLNITDDFEIADLNYRIDALTTPGAGDLTSMLRSPDGTGVDVVALIDGLNDVGGTAVTKMLIDDQAGNTPTTDMVEATTADAPYTKSWLPVYNSPWATLVNATLPADTVGNLSHYHGKSTKGTWSAHFADVFSATTGGTDGSSTLSSWSMLVTPVHFDCTAFAPTVAISASKTVSGTLTVGGTVTYTVTLTNNGTAGQADNAGHEFTDVLPAGLTLVNVTATSGTASSSGNTVAWDGALAPLGGSTTITITATINTGTQGTTISNQGTVSYDSNGDGVNDATLLTDDPAIGGSADPTSFTVGSAALTASKTVSGSFRAGGAVSYTVVISNSGADASPDNAGDEFTDVLPASLTLLNATATSGTAITSGNTATWNGSVPAGGSVTVTINATVNAGVALGSTISNQGTVSYDADLNGSNETTVLTDDPSVGGSSDPTVFTVQGASVSATKTVSGSFVQGGTVTYSVLLSNAGNAATLDNPGNEFTDVLPTSLTLLSTSAGSGTAAANTGTNTVTWNGSIPANGSVPITITARVNSGTLGSTISNQGSFAYDADLNGSNESSGVTDDPGLPGTADPTSFTVGGALVSGSKTVTGNFAVGGSVTYTIVLNNAGPSASSDNPGNELTDVLPAGLTLVSANASSGAAVATIASNTVTWNGSIGGGGSVTITIQATIAPSAAGHTLSNQATISYDADLNGSNETTVLTDDPGRPGLADATQFAVPAAATAVVPVPALSSWAALLLLLGVMLGSVAQLRARRRR